MSREFFYKGAHIYNCVFYVAKCFITTKIYELNKYSCITY